MTQKPGKHACIQIGQARSRSSIPDRGKSIFFS